ncbi:MAG: type II toxin-antitoxin system VapC family toxin [Acidobacteriota bacterium]
MRFWDASAMVPLCVIEAMSPVITRLLKEDEAMVVWWGSRVELVSALARRHRAGALDSTALGKAIAVLDSMAGKWSEIQPVSVVRDAAERLLRVHPLRAADALQVAAALLWSGPSPRGHVLICLDRNMRNAAEKEGFTVLPPSDRIPS